MYAKRFGVTLEWLLTGEGEKRVATTVAGIPVMATPIVGSLSNQTWTERAEIDVKGEFPHQLEIAVLAGGPETRWFAVHLPDMDNLPDGYLPGDHLVCRATDEILPSDLCVVDRSGFDGQLRQLILAQCSFTNGTNVLMSRTDSSGRYETAIEGDYRVLGKIEALYRSV